MLENSIPVLLKKDLGWFADDTALSAKYPTGRPGDYARLKSTGTIWYWDGNDWADTNVSASTLTGGKVTFENTDPDTVVTPPAGMMFMGTYNARLWTKQPDGEIRWIKYDDGQWYGVEWDVTVSSPDLKRIGDWDLHRTLPIQNSMYSCLLKDDGTENYKLDPTDWSKQDDGVTASNLDGTDGQVMIYLPKYYVKFEQEGNYRRLKLSQYPLAGFSEIKAQYVSAYEAALDRVNLKLASVKNLTADYRGGNNNTSLDGADATQLGKPATLISRTNFRTYARARGTGYEMYNYISHRTLFWFFMVEFATHNSQKAVNAVLDTNGFRQGGLGNGVTTISSTDWSTFNSYYPIIPVGTSDTLANGTGEVSYTLPASFGSGSVTVKVNRYRGVEMPFGHNWKNSDGIIVRMAANDDADPTTKAFVSDVNTIWNDTDYSSYDLQGEMPRVNGYITKMLPFNIMPLQVDGGSSTYWCDYSYQSNIPADGSSASLRAVLFGGHACNGGFAGFGCSYSFYSASYTSAYFGSRLCFIPA